MRPRRRRSRRMPSAISMVSALPICLPVRRERDDQDVRKQQRRVTLVEGEHVQALLLQRRLDPVRQARRRRGLELALQDVDVVVEVLEARLWSARWRCEYAFAPCRSAAAA